MLMTNRVTSSFDPWRVMRAIEDQWNHQWGDWIERAPLVRSQTPVRTWLGDGKAVLEFDLPGLRPESINVSVHEHRLTVEVSPQPVEPAEGEVLHLQERLPAMSREVQLPFAVDSQHTAAEYQHGVLRVTVQQPESHRPARIAVKG